MKKRISVLLVVVIMIMSLAGCGSKKIDGINMTLEEFRTSVNEVYSERTGEKGKILNKFSEYEIEGIDEITYRSKNEHISVLVYESGEIYILIYFVDFTEEGQQVFYDYDEDFEKWQDLVYSIITVLNPDYTDSDLQLISKETCLGDIDDKTILSFYEKDGYDYIYGYYSVIANFDIVPISESN